MEKDSENPTRDAARQDEIRDERASNGKKPYRKPELVRHEQLHGIGLGSP